MAGVISPGTPVYIHSICDTGVLCEVFTGKAVAYVVHLFNGLWASCPDWDVEILH